MPDESEKFSIDFAETGADEVVTKSKKIASEMNAVAAAMRKINATRTEEGGELSPVRMRFHQESVKLEKELTELRKKRAQIGTTREDVARERQIKRELKNLEKQDLKELDREESQVRKAQAAQQRQVMGEQKAHVRWISRAMQAVGLGRFAPTGATGAAVLGAAQELGIPGVLTAAGGIGPVGWGALAAGAAVGAPIAAGVWANRRILGQNPAHKIGMGVAGYVNPFEAMQDTRIVSNVLQAGEGFLTRVAGKLARGTDRLLRTVGGGFADFDKPGIGEVLAVKQMTDPLVGASRATSDLSKMGLYASVGEMVATRGSMAWQQELIEVLKRVGGTLDSITRNTEDAKIGGGGRSMSR